MTRTEPVRGVAGPRAVALAILAVGVLLLVGALQIPTAGTYQAVGPQVFPLIVAVAVCVLGVLNTARAFFRPDPHQVEEAREEARATHWPTVGLLAAALVLYGVLLDPLGYWPATASLVVAVARILGSRSVVRDVVVGLMLPGTAYLAFTHLLGISLPAGLLSGII